MDVTAKAPPPSAVAVRSSVPETEVPSGAVPENVSVNESAKAPVANRSTAVRARTGPATRANLSILPSRDIPILYVGITYRHFASHLLTTQTKGFLSALVGGVRNLLHTFTQSAPRSRPRRADSATIIANAFGDEHRVRLSSALQLNDAPARGNGHRLRAIARSQFLHDALHMNLHRRFRDEQLLSDVAVP